MKSLDSPADFLTAAYQQLAFERGTLLQAARAPRSQAREEWLERGDWQFLAAEVGAERIFFVDRDPVVVFAKADDGSPEVLKKLYERIWCMSRPQLLFLASPGELIRVPPRLS